MIFSPRIYRYIGIGLTIFVVLLILYYLRDLVVYIIIAQVLALLGQPIMRTLGKVKVKGKALSDTVRAVMVIGLYFLIVSVVIYAIVPLVIKQANTLRQVNYAALSKSLDEPISKLNDRMIELGLMEGAYSNYHEEAPKKDTSAYGSFIDSTLANSNIHDRDIVKRSMLVQVDSFALAKGDTFTRTNITLNINIVENRAMGDGLNLTDSTALVKDSDTPLEKMQKKLYSYINPAKIPSLFSYLIGLLGSISIAIASIVFILFFFLKEEGLFLKGVVSTLPEKLDQDVREVMTRIRILLRRYFLGILIQISIITVVALIGLSIFGVENALLIALFAAIINVIPYVGPIIGAVFGIVLTLASNMDANFYEHTLPLVIKVAGVFAFVQMLDNFVLQPVIFSRSVHAHPLEIFLVIMIAAKLGGIIGMVVAIPAYTIVRVIGAEFFQEFYLVRRLTEGLNEQIDGQVEDQTD